MADFWTPPLSDPSTLPSKTFDKASRIVVQRPPRVRTRPEVKNRARLPGYINEDRVAEQWDEENPTRGSQYGHTNDEAHAWVWL